MRPLVIINVPVFYFSLKNKKAEIDWSMSSLRRPPIYLASQPNPLHDSLNLDCVNSKSPRQQLSGENKKDKI